MNYKVGMISLGCAKNQVDAEMLLYTLKERGFQFVSDPEEADAVIVNTCGFIESAKQESIDEILELGNLKREGKIKAIVVTGCLAERYQDEITKQLYEIDAAVGIGANDKIADVVLKAPSRDLINGLSRSVLTLYSYDDNPEDISPANILRQSMQIIGKMPAMATYLYHAYQHIVLDENLVIKNPKPEYSTAENLLYMLRPDGNFTELEAKVLDVALVLHAEHGGGNNSTFTAHVVTSSGTDTYSALSASIASLKGFRHGGANLKVKHMMEEIMANVKNWEDEEEIRDYLVKILDKQAFDRNGLIYGIGHAVYTYSDPREVILKQYAAKLAAAKGREREYEFYDRVERIAKATIASRRHLFKPICANVDFYSGLVYDILGIPEALFTPIFAISRISGWSAHRLEEVINKGKIIRPAYKYVGHHRPYKEMDVRKG